MQQKSQDIPRTTLRYSLNYHIHSIHKGTELSCLPCEYKARYKGKLSQLVRSVREDVQSSCPHCKYEATKRANLRAHTQSVHEKMKLDCTHCKYEAPGNRNLKTHTKPHLSIPSINTYIQNIKEHN